MKGKLLLLALGYVVWNVINSTYGWSENSAFRKKLKEAQLAGEDTKMMILDHFTETHKNLFKELDAKYMTEENKAYLAEQKDNLKQIVKEYKSEGEKMISEMKENPEESFDIMAEKLQNLYDVKKWQLEHLTQEAPEKAKSLKDSLLARYESFKSNKNV
jgi:hypothetical protein